MTQPELPEVTSITSDGNLAVTAWLDQNRSNQWLTSVPCLENFGRFVSLFTKCRRAQWVMGYLDMTEGLRKYGKTYILGLHYSFSDCVGRDALDTSSCRPNVTSRLLHCGKSSLETSASLRLDVDDFHIVDNVIKWVYLGKESRSPLPEWFREKYDRGRLNRDPSLRLRPSDETRARRELFQRSFPIVPKHIDQFGHTNHEFYVEFLVETVHEFLRFGADCQRYGGINQPLRSVEIMHVHDSFVGDVVKVAIVKINDDIPGSEYEGLTVRMSKENGDGTLVNCHIEFKKNPLSKI